MAAGRTTTPKLITFTAIMLAVMRQVAKIAAITTSRCETFTAAPSASYRQLNPALAAEEVEYPANNNQHNKEHIEEGKL